MDKLKLFLISCMIFLYSCSPKPFMILSYTKQFSPEQIDSVFVAENLPKTGWIEANVFDEETSDTLINSAFYREIENDSIKAIKYIYRKINGSHYFSKQVIKKNK